MDPVTDAIEPVDEAPPAPPVDDAPPAAPVGDPYSERIEALENELRYQEAQRQQDAWMAQQRYEQAQQTQTPQPQGLPEWNPWDPEVVQAYQAQWIGHALGPMLADVQRSSQMMHLERGEQVAAMQYDQAVSDTALQEAPDYVRAQFAEGQRDVLEDVLLRLSAPYISQGYEPGQVYGRMAQDVAALLEATGKAAVEAYRASLASAAEAVAEPSAGLAAAQSIGAPHQMPGESPYRAAARAALTRTQPSVPA